jgi:hypothetical protein
MGSQSLSVERQPKARLSAVHPEPAERRRIGGKIAGARVAIEV